ncbi:UNKNOWN [Stylonychia lemnae]|uniref:Uncharacterized protein n=1 Tax=Stylonychia lemnae TaxID=5949 RepID=A0A078AUQ8_STYLE|nr:UNKNOWN [Stylonychia lemnae]|eukprot:CDW84977.1 UNKNOWN [Stylonychia lemnae]
MLLLKFEKFSIISKDSFLEELLFKYEKNVEHYQKFEKKGKQALAEMIRIIDEQDGKMSMAFEQINEQYGDLKQACDKLQQLSENQDYVFQTFTESMNKKLVDSENTNILKEVYRLQKYIGSLHHEFKDDIQSKIKLVYQTLPQIVFLDIGDSEENLMLMLDVWTYHNQISISSS